MPAAADYGRNGCSNEPYPELPFELARRSEVESLDWSGIDLDAGILANHGTKTKGSDRATPIPVELLVELRKIPEASRVGRVVGAWPFNARQN